ncbi:MAG: hypothetical protein KF878_28885 [Planctomycetes bacterium]|nr:hypothetical protein [Planctomycetota bacterium]
MNRTALLAVAALLTLAPVALGQSRPDLTGAYGVVGEDGRRIGQASISGEGDALVLRVRLLDGTERPALKLDAARTTAARFLFAAPAEPTGTGLATIVEGGSGGATTPAAARTVEVTRGNDGALRAVLRQGEAVVARERLVRVRAALLVHAQTYDSSHVNAFRAYATTIARRYKSAGYVTAETLLGTSVEVVVERLLRAEAEGHPFERLVFIGHGGWDGPVLGTYSDPGHRQASGVYNQEMFGTLVDAIRRGTTPAARIFASACHAGGSNVYERARPHDNKYVWTDDLAVRTGRIAAGPAGYTSTEYTERHVWAVLEGEGTTVQEVRWASATNARTIRPKGTLTGSPLLPRPTIALPTPAAPTPAATPTTTPAAVVDLPLGDPAQ